MASKFSEESMTIRFCPPFTDRNFCTVIRYHRIGKRFFQCHKQQKFVTTFFGPSEHGFMQKLDHPPYPHNTAMDEKSWEGDCVCCEQYIRFYEPVKHRFLPLETLSPPSFYKGSESDFNCDVKNLRPINAYYFNIIDRGMEDKGVSKFSCGTMLYKRIIEGIRGNESNPNVVKLCDITHMVKGHDFYVQKRIKPTNSGETWIDYNSCQFLPSTPLGTTEQVMGWMNQLHDLEKLRILSSKEEMLSAMEEVFGYLGSIRRKQIYRSISDPFNPAW